MPLQALTVLYTPSRVQLCVPYGPRASYRARGPCSIVDTFWQTETGGHMLTPLPGATPQKPGSATLPFFGVEVRAQQMAGELRLDDALCVHRPCPQSLSFTIVSHYDHHTAGPPPQIVLKDRDGKVLEGNDVSGVVCVARPWPAIARTIYGDHDRCVCVRSGRGLRLRLVLRASYLTQLSSPTLLSQRCPPGVPSSQLPGDVHASVPRQLLHGRRRHPRQGRLLLDHRPRGR
jgi:hypothetical protein